MSVVIALVLLVALTWLVGRNQPEEEPARAPMVPAQRGRGPAGQPARQRGAH